MEEFAQMQLFINEYARPLIIRRVWRATKLQTVQMFQHPLRVVRSVSGAVNK